MATANTKRNKDADDNDLYTTPLGALGALWEVAPKVLKRSKSITDPAFGLGDITRFFKEKGLYTVGNDLYNYGEDFSQWNDKTTYVNFLEEGIPVKHDKKVMVVNPPFTLTAEFLDKSLEEGYTNIFMFNRLNTLESVKRSMKFKSKEWPLRKVWVFERRVSCPKGVNYENTANSVAYAWYWLDADYEGEPTLGWV